MTTGVFQILNELTQDAYVGGSVNVEKRWIDIRGGHNVPNKLYKAMHHYGKEHFRLSILQTCRVSQLRLQTTYWVGTLQPTLNGDHVGTWGMLGHQHTSDSKQRIGQANRGKAPMKGHVYDAAARKRMSIAVRKAKARRDKASKQTT